LRIQGPHAHRCEDDLRATYKRLVQEERRRLDFRAAWIRLQIPPGGGAEAVTEVKETAAQVSARARSGADFGELARRYSADASTKNQGGLLATMRVGELPRRGGQRPARPWKVGEVTAPLRQGDAWLVLKLVERAEGQIPDYEKAKPQLQSRGLTAKRWSRRAASGSTACAKRTALKVEIPGSSGRPRRRWGGAAAVPQCA
jgi:hypothetical protein